MTAVLPSNGDVPPRLGRIILRASGGPYFRFGPIYVSSTANLAGEPFVGLARHSKADAVKPERSTIQTRPAGADAPSGSTG